MEWQDPSLSTAPPLVPRPADAAAPPADPAGPAHAPVATSTGPGIKRMVATAVLSGLLLVGGAVAVVSAASPDPSCAPSTNGGTTTQPSARPNHSGSTADCPNMGGSGGTNGSGAPAPSTTPGT
jgi:hypothetical protein